MAAFTKRFSKFSCLVYTPEMALDAYARLPKKEQQLNLMTILNKPATSSATKALAWLPVIIVMIAAAWTHYTVNSTINYLLLGGDGPYYPLQVRSLLEHQRLAYPDMPLLFIAEGMLAALLNFFGIASYNDCIILAIKTIDVAIPPLAAIPVFLMSKELRIPGIRSGFLNYLLVAFSVINLTTVGAFSNGLQKNAVAVVWIFLYLYFLIRLIDRKQKKDALYAGLVLVLCAFTHFGSCSLLIFISLLTGISWLLYNKQAITSLNVKKISIPLVTILVLLAVIAYYDTGRFHRLMSIPFKVFEFPVFLLMANGFGIENFLSPIHLLFTNFLALIGVFLLIANRKKMEKERKLIAWAMVAAAFFLASPLLGLEWANRLYIISYIPVVVLYVILFNSITSKWAKVIPASAFSLFVFLCLVSRPSNKECITQESYEEFVQLKHHIKFHEQDAIIGRQDLRILGSWEFRTKSIVEYLFKKEDFAKYHAVYVIRQLKGSNFPPGRFRGDARVPNNSIKVYSGQCFELYRLKSGEGWKGGKGKASKGHGIILALTPKYLLLQNDQGFRRTIELTPQTLTDTPLRTGLSVEVWGNWKPFSLDVVAESIRELRD